MISFASGGKDDIIQIMTIYSGEIRLIEYSGQFYTVIPEVGNRRSDVKETVIPEPWKPWFLPL